MLLKPGMTWKSRYEILSLVGEGGFAAVYKARDLELGRNVAIKLLKSQAISAEDLARFKREAHLLAKLSHRNIVAVYSYDVVADTTPCITMEFLQGESLDSWINKRGPLDEQTCMTIFTGIADALTYAHTQGIVHRDLSSANVFIEDIDGSITAKIIDFGLSSIVNSDKQLSIDKLTATGLLVGNPAYMSPEQTRGEKLDSRSDIYSLGCTLYKAVTGEPPFDSSTPTGYLYLHQNEYPHTPAINWNDTKAAEKVEAILLKCLQKDPAKRFQSAEEFKENLLGKAGLQFNSNHLDTWADQQSTRKKQRSIKLIVTTAVAITLLFIVNHLDLLEKQYAKLLTFIPGTGVLEQQLIGATKDPAVRITLLNDLLKEESDPKKIIELELALAKQLILVGEQKEALSRIAQVTGQIRSRPEGGAPRMQKLALIDQCVALINKCSGAAVNEQQCTVHNESIRLLSICLEESINEHVRPLKAHQYMLFLLGRLEQRDRPRVSEENTIAAGNAIIKLLRNYRMSMAEQENTMLFDLTCRIPWKNAVPLFDALLANPGATEEQKRAWRLQKAWTLVNLNPNLVDYRYVTSSNLETSYPGYAELLVHVVLTSGDVSACRAVLKDFDKLNISENGKLVIYLAVGDSEKAFRIGKQICDSLPAEIHKEGMTHLSEQQDNFKSALEASTILKNDDMLCSVIRAYASYFPGLQKQFSFANFRGAIHSRIVELIVGLRSEKCLEAAKSLIPMSPDDYKNDFLRATFCARIFSAISARDYNLALDLFKKMKKETVERKESLIELDHIDSLIQCGLGNMQLARELHEKIESQYISGSEQLVRIDARRLFMRREMEMIEVAIDSNHEEYACECLEKILADSAVPARAIAYLLSQEQEKVKSPKLKQLIERVNSESGFKPSVTWSRVFPDRLDFTRIRN